MGRMRSPMVIHIEGNESQHCDVEPNMPPRIETIDGVLSSTNVISGFGKGKMKKL